MERKDQSDDDDSQIKCDSDSNKIQATKTEIRKNTSYETNKEEEKIETNSEKPNINRKWYTDCIHKIVAFFTKIITFLVYIFTFCCCCNTDDDTSDYETSNENQENISNDLSNSDQEFFSNEGPNNKNQACNDKLSDKCNSKEAILPEDIIELRNIELDSEKQHFSNENNEIEQYANENQSNLGKSSSDNFNQIEKIDFQLFSNENDTNQAKYNDSEIAIKLHIQQSSSEEINSNIAVEVKNIKLSSSQNLISNESIDSNEKQEINEDKIETNPASDSTAQSHSNEPSNVEAGNVEENAKNDSNSVVELISGEEAAIRTKNDEENSNDVQDSTVQPLSNESAGDVTPNDEKDVNHIQDSPVQSLSSEKAIAKTKDDDEKDVKNVSDSNSQPLSNETVSTDEKNAEENSNHGSNSNVQQLSSEEIGKENKNDENDANNISDSTVQPLSNESAVKNSTVRPLSTEEATSQTKNDDEDEKKVSDLNVQQLLNEPAGTETKDKEVENSKSHNAKKNQPKIKFSSFIEVDLHETSDQISNVLDWVPIIRDLLYDSLKKKVNIVKFITGHKSTQPTVPVLRPLVFLISKRLGFGSYISLTNSSVIYVDIATYKDDPNDLNDYKELTKMTSIETFSDDPNETDKNDTKRYTSHQKFDTPNDAYDDDDMEEEGLDFDNDYDIVEDFDGIDDFNFYETNNDTKGADDVNDNDDADNPFYQDSAFLIVKKRFPSIPNICVKIICTKRNDEQALHYAEEFEEMIIKDDKKGYTKFLNQKVTGEGLINIRKRNKQIINKTNVKDALNVFDVEKVIDSKRDDGSPRFIHSIEIDLSHAELEIAKKAVDEVMNAMFKVDYAEMILNFSLEPKGCSINDVIEFVHNKELPDNVHIKERNKERQNHFIFAIYNEDYEI